MTLRIGLLGASRVAKYAAIAAAKDVEGVEITAIASRDPDKALSYARENNIALAFGSYQDLIESDAVDAIYNGLPPNLHAQWSIAAVEAGKDVLCEKPFALDVSDVEAMLSAEAKTNRLIMEAQHTHYHPRHARIRQIVQSGQLGKIRHIEAQFDVPVPVSDEEIRWDGSVGGGAIWDLGIYPLYWLRATMGEEPTLVSARHSLNNKGADIWTEATFSFPGGATGAIRSSMQRDFAAWLRIVGEAGELYVDNPLSPKLQTLNLTVEGVAKEECFTERPTYSFQLEAFRDAICDGKPVHTRGKDSLATISILSEIRATANKE
jgi:predicted dehydrogenase